jgi:hypothetical protein
MDVADEIRAMLGQQTAAPDAPEPSPPAIKAIATNGSLLNQNVSRLSQTLGDVLTELGAP